MSAARFEHYQVLTREDGSLWELGRGAMGVTYKAVDTDLHCPVALKIINPDILGSEGTEERFLREARAAAQLRHPNIANVLRLGKAADTHFYAMEFCEGQTLQQAVEEKGPLDLATALNAARQVTNALIVAEEHQLVHRDIKPANLIFSQRRDEGLVVKVIDFGLAKSWGAAGTAWNSMNMSTAGFLGTAHFSSPEQLEERAVDVRADIYSLGATLWFMLTGKPVFGGSIARVMSQHIFSPPPFAQLEPLHLPQKVTALLQSMLEKDPAARPQSASELKRALDACLASGADDDAAVTLAASSIPLAIGPGTILNGRWQLLEERGHELFRAIDRQEKHRPVAVRLLDRAVAEDAETWTRLTTTADALQEPAGGLMRVHALDRDATGRPFVVLEWVDGFSLLQLLQRRGALTLRETLRLLTQCATAYDYLAQNRVDGAAWTMRQVLIGFEGEAPAVGRLETLGQRPVTEWPEFRVAITAFPMNGCDVEESSFASMRTMLPLGKTIAAPQSTRPVGVAELGWLVFELLGGHRASAEQTGRYVPSARLNASGNAVLQRAIMPRAGDLPFASGREFFEALGATADFEPAWKPAAQAVRADAPKARPAPPRKHVWIAAAALVVGAITVSAVLLRKDNDSPATSSATTAPAPNAAKAPEPAAPASIAQSTVPPPPLPGTLEATQRSPKGTMRVEHRSELAQGKGRAIWLISTADETKRERLYSHLRTASVVFSPDENWLVINDHPDSNAGGGAQLYRRTRPGELAYDVPANMSCARDRIEDLAWSFYARHVLQEPNAPRNRVLIDCVEWQPDATAFTLRFTAVDAAGEEQVPVPFACRFHLTTEQFTAASDIGSARSAVAERARARARLALANQTPVPFAAREPQVREFVISYLTAMRANDTERILSHYADEVNYFAKGRVTQAEIRQDWADYRERWPYRRDTVVDDRITVEEVPGGVAYRASFRQTLLFASPPRGDCLRGEWGVGMLVHAESGQMKIADIKEQLVRSERGTLQQGANGLVMVWPSEPGSAPQPAVNSAPAGAGPNSFGAAILTGVLQGLANGLDRNGQSYSTPSSPSYSRSYAPMRTRQSHARSSRPARRSQRASGTRRGGSSSSGSRVQRQEN